MRHHAKALPEQLSRHRSRLAGRCAPLGRVAAGAVTVLALFAMAPLSASAVLPDGRSYEMVSPAKKSGAMAGALDSNGAMYAWATDDGSGLLYGTNGAIGTTDFGAQSSAVASRSEGGWTSRSPFPRPRVVNYFAGIVYSLFPSTDLSKVAFSGVNFSAQPPQSGADVGIFLSDMGAAATNLTQPRDPSAVVATRTSTGTVQIAGGSPDLSTVYFSFSGALLAGEEARGQQVAAETAGGPGGRALGFYEYRDGQLSAAAVLPDGTLPEYGAAPAAVFKGDELGVWSSDEVHNQVSSGGSTAFFVSPDPYSVSTEPHQIYARIDGTHTVLVSRSDLLQGPAPHGAMPFAGASACSACESYIQASSDGSRVFFQSTDQLTPDAPADGTVKAYVFDLGSGTQTYLPGVADTVPPIGDGASNVKFLASAPDGSQLLFLDSAGNLASWSAAGGVSTVATIAAPPFFKFGQIQSTADGSLYVFATNGTLAGFPNPGDFYQVYRYHRDTGEVECLSCGSDAAGPSGHAFLGHNSYLGQDAETNGAPTNQPRAAHEMSADGRRVFFDTTDALVTQDTNGKRDVYQWSDGQLSLISTGKSSRPSYYLDNSSSGDDVFFATAEGLQSDDTDGSFDVYDARVGGGFAVVGQPAPCQGDGCQGSRLAVPPPPAAGTAGFVGRGNRKPHRPKAQQRRKHQQRKHQQRKHHKKASHKRASLNHGGVK